MSTPNQHLHDRFTDEALTAIEARLHRIYKKAADEMTRKAQAFYERLVERDLAMRRRVASGAITQAEYETWLRRQLVTGRINEDMRDTLARQVTDTNVAAAEYVDGQLPEIFAVNHNYEAYGLERTYGDLSFTLYDAETVRRLITQYPELLPEISERLAVDIPLDLRWNREKIVDVITSAILQGKTIPQIAGELETVVGMNEGCAIRNARTAVTSAQNAGRQASYEHAAEMGIAVRKRWVATLDGRTRHSHRAMDGVTVAYNEPFVTPLGSVMQYPGDRDGKAGDVYNCRCTVRTVEKPGIEAEERKRRVRDPVTGKNVVVSDMTYPEWERWVRKRSGTADSPPTAKMDERKLTQYALVPGKSKGKSEAFRSALGYTVENAADLQEKVLQHFSVDKLRDKGYNGYGETFELVMRLKGPNGKEANVLTAWIHEEDGTYRLTSIYVTDKEADV